MKFKITLLMVVFFLKTALSLNAQVAEIPIEFNGKHIFIKVKTGAGDSLRFIFDTGSTGISIDSGAAKNAGIDMVNRKAVTVNGSGGAKGYMMAMHQKLKMNTVELTDVNLVLVDFSSLSASIGSRLDGIIGYDILKKYVTQIDFENKKILLYNRIESADTTGYTGIPFEFSKSILIPRFPISITLANGESFTGKVMFDTGNAFTLIVSTPFAKYHNFSNKLGETSFTGGIGANAVTKDQLATINALSFNGFSFGKMGIRLTVNDAAEARDGYLGILGIEIIKRFNVILDYANRKIHLKPNEEYGNEFKKETIKQNYTNDSYAFLEKNKNKPGIKVMPSGLQYKIIKKGNGPIPTMQDRVTMHYTTSLFNGQKLWNTYDSNKPWVHHLDKALPGVREAALMMPTGSKWMLYIPASLASGQSGFEEVPPGAAIIYEMEILKTER